MPVTPGRPFGLFSRLRLLSPFSRMSQLSLFSPFGQLSPLLSTPTTPLSLYPSTPLPLPKKFRRCGEDVLDGDLPHAALFSACAGRVKAPPAIKTFIEHFRSRATGAPLGRIGRPKQRHHRHAQRRRHVHGTVVVPDEQRASLQHGGILKQRQPAGKRDGGCSRIGPYRLGQITLPGIAAD